MNNSNNNKKVNNQQLQVQKYIVKIANFLINNIIGCSVGCESYELKWSVRQETHYFVYIYIHIYNILDKQKSRVSVY